MSLTTVTESNAAGDSPSAGQRGRFSRLRRVLSRREQVGLRPDIQGLRAVAVLAVIADHMFGWPKGGFVGVDVFFVISGFLITGLLLREWKQTGTISFGAFYRRRIKRILPVSLLVIAATLVATRFLFATPRFIETATDSLWATFFAANWRFLLQGSDYFQADGPISPLRHYWSLAVEEQFYFVWPWILLAALVWLTHRGAGRSFALRISGLLIAVLSLASFVWSVYETSSDPGAAYYSSFSRAWELGIGAILAFAVPVLEGIPDRVRPVLANAGLLGIVVSVFALSANNSFPAPGALLPVLSTALVIVAGTGGEQKFVPALTNPVSRYLGDISFSLYLWHFPVIVCLGALLQPGSRFYFAMSLFITLGLSAYSYRLVEDPIRKSSWLSPRPKPRGEAPGATRRLGSGRGGIIRVVAGLAAFLVVATGAVGLKVASTTSEILAPTFAAHRDFPPAPVDGPAGETLRREIQLAVPATTWPDFEPSLEYLMSEDPHPDRVKNCGDPGNHSAEECTFGPKGAAKNAVLVGDSISQRWAFPLTKIYAEKGWNIRIFGRPGCPFNDYPRVVASAERQAVCAERKQQAIDFIQKTKPDLVIVGNTMVPERMATTGKAATPADWQAGMESILGKIPAAAQRLILSPPPFDKDVRKCYTPVSGPRACLGGVTPLWYDIAKADTSASRATHSVYLDTRALFCTGEDACPAFAGGIPIKKDHTHFTLPYGYHLQGALEELLEKRGLW